MPRIELVTIMGEAINLGALMKRGALTPFTAPPRFSAKLSAPRLSWLRLSEQIFRIDKWSLCRG
jgi:hypothetical protein